MEYPSVAGYLKVNFDGAIFQDFRSIGVGIVVRDELWYVCGRNAKKV